MLAIAPLVFAVALLPQDPTEPLANYQLNGKPAVVTRTDVALEMAFDLQRRDRGRQAIEMLVDTTLTRRAAEQQGVMPAPGDPEVQALWRQLQEQLRAAGRRPEEFATVRNTTEEQWLDDLAVQLAQQRLVRKELALRDHEAVSADMLKLWLQEQKKRVRVVTDPDALPIGTVARIDKSDLALLDLGFLLLRTSEDEERDRFIRQVAYLTTIEAIARDAGIVVTADDLDLAIEVKRKDAAQDPRFRGATLDRLLEAQGLTVQSLREGRVFRSQILLDKLGQKRFPDPVLVAEITQDRQRVLDLVGPRRRIGIVFARALEQPNGLVKDDFATARQRLEGVLQRLEKQDFGEVARIESDHAPSKPNGGDLGWHRRQSDKIPPVILDAAFSLPIGAISAPQRTDEGWYLVKAIEAEPEPDDDVLRRRWREHRNRELQQDLLRQADVQLLESGK